MKFSRSRWIGKRSECDGSNASRWHGRIMAPSLSGSGFSIGTIWSGREGRRGAGFGVLAMWCSVNVLDLFSGIGGFSLGLERAGMRTVAFCEIDPYCQAVLRKHWPDVPVYGDVRDSRPLNGLCRRRCNGRGNATEGATSQAEAASRISDYKIDVICGGFPCQDISVAGKGAGIEGSRSGLWSEYARIIGEVRPRYVIVENVAALLGRGLERVLGDLAELGYDAEWDCFPTGLNFGHRRERVWIVAYDVQSGLAQRIDNDTNSIDETSIFTRERFACLFESIDPAQKWKDRPLLGRGIYGLPGRVDRIAALGNSLIPQIPEIIGRAIMKRQQKPPREPALAFWLCGAP